MATRLPFTAALLVGMNSLGDTILAEHEGSRLFMWTRSHGEISQRWSRDLPSNIEPNCQKAVTGTGHALFQNYYSKYSSAPTIMLREDGEVTTWQHEGHLLTCLPPERRVYVQEKEADPGDWEIVIVEQGGERRLRSPPGYIWSSPLLSVCESRERVAVVDVDWDMKKKRLRGKPTLSIFHQFKHHTTVPLGYQPWGWSAVCCSQDHLFVAEWASSSIHIHSWEGTHSQSVSLDVGRGDIWCVTYIDNEKTLQAAVVREERGDHITHSLHALQLHLKYAPDEMAREKRQIEENTRKWKREQSETHENTD